VFFVLAFVSASCGPRVVLGVAVKDMDLPDSSRQAEKQVEGILAGLSLKQVSGEEAVQALSGLGKEAILPLVRRVEDDDWGVRSVVLEALIALGPNEPDVVSLLVKVMGKRDWCMDMTPEFLSVALAAHAPGSCPIVLEALSSGNKDAKESAEYTLSLIGDACGESSSLAPKGAGPGLPVEGLENLQVDVPLTEKEKKECLEGSTGYLTVNTLPSMTVSVDGKPIKDVPVIKHKLPPGKHEVTLGNELYGFKKTLGIDLDPCKSWVIIQDYRDEIWGCVKLTPEADEAWEKKLYDPKSLFPPGGLLPRPFLWQDIACTMRMLYPKIGACEGIQWGTLTLTVIVSKDGTVRAAKVHGDQADTKVGECITGIIYKAVFPPFEGKLTRQFTWPLAFPVDKAGPEADLDWPVFYGCGVKGFQSIFFESGSAEINSKGKEKLDTTADTMMRGISILHVHVVGRADKKEKAAVKLSLQRAQAVVDYLVSKGVEPSRLSAGGYGKYCPSDSLTPMYMSPLERNRRADFKILEVHSGCTEVEFACDKAVKAGLVPEEAKIYLQGAGYCE